MLAISTVIMFGNSNTNSEEEKTRIETVTQFTTGQMPSERSLDSRDTCKLPWHNVT